jgi:hypothetical protein
MTEKTDKRMQTKTIVWGVIAAVSIISLTAIALVGDEAAHAWTERILIFCAGLAVPGSPLGALFARGKAAAGTAVALLLAVVVATSNSGCGAGAIQVQARAATVATVALESAHGAVMDETERRLDACTDVACTQDVERAMAPIALAHEAARVALVGWVDALQLAMVAGEDGDVISALLTAGARWLSLWDPLAAALAGVGVDVPRLPPLVSGLLGGAR